VIELLDAEDREEARLDGCGVRGGAGVDVAVTSGARKEAPQEAQNLEPDSISRPQEEQCTEDSFATNNPECRP
jgi:hypothetical protein